MGYEEPHLRLTSQLVERHFPEYSYTKYIQYVAVYCTANQGGLELCDCPGMLIAARDLKHGKARSIIWKAYSCTGNGMGPRQGLAEPSSKAFYLENRVDNATHPHTLQAQKNISVTLQEQRFFCHL